MSVLREVAFSAGHFILSSNVGDRELVSLFLFFFFLSPEMIFSCLFWQTISEKWSYATILASSNSFLAPPPSHLLSLLFLFLTIPTLVSFGVFFFVACLYLFVILSVTIFHPSTHCFSKPSRETTIVCTYTHLATQRFKSSTFWL